jgi:AcrR family transcriptional regulator
MPARRGRPSKASQALTRDAILEAARRRLEEDGTGTVSLRLIAFDLGVTPMALYTHVEGMDDILDALAEQWFVKIPEPGLDDARRDLGVLLCWYCTRVLEHPGLTSALVARQGHLPTPHKSWTDRVTQVVEGAGLSPDWSDILVDHLHGYALSQAAGGTAGPRAIAQYERQMGLMLDALFSASLRLVVAEGARIGSGDGGEN